MFMAQNIDTLLCPQEVISKEISWKQTLPMLFKLEIPFLQTKRSYESSFTTYLAQEWPIPERSKELILPLFFFLCPFIKYLLLSIKFIQRS